MSTAEETLEGIRLVGVIPVVTLPSPKDALPLCETLIHAGLPVVEVTFRTPGAAEAISLIAERHPGMLVGAGTVTDGDQAVRAKAAGADFAVAPGFNPDVASAAAGADLTFWPGVSTPTEIEAALAAGHRVLKFFPAGALGGAATVKAMLAPYLHLGVQLVPTGGIDEDSAPAYWGMSGVVAVGGSWIAPPELIEAGDWREIQRRARASVVRYRAIQGKPL